MNGGTVASVASDGGRGNLELDNVKTSIFVFLNDHRMQPKKLAFPSLSYRGPPATNLSAHFSAFGH